MASALRLPPRPNAEGVVVHLVDSGVQVKIKQDDYLRLHRIAFSLSPKGVWEHLVAHGGDESELVAGIPDEFHGWIRDQASRLRQAFYGVYDVTLAAHRDLVAALPVGYSMKEFAFAVNALPSDALPNRQLLFSVERGNSIMGPIWKMIKPVSGEIPMLGGSLE